MRILAIDPGNLYSAYCLIDTDTMKPLQFDKTENAIVRAALEQKERYDKAVIEMIGHYGTGMPAGKSVFDTCVWIGRFMETAERTGRTIDLLMRREEKLDLCGSMKAKDSNIVQALIDRFAPNTANRGKGRKNQPGWFYGFHADIWQAYAVGFTYIDKISGRR